MKITSTESLDSHVAEAVRRKIRRVATAVRMETEIAAIQKKFAPDLAAQADAIAEIEADIQLYCEAHRAELFPDKKSRENIAAVFGFELTPWRVETAGKKIKWKDVIQRLKRLAWGGAYLRTPDPHVDKEALGADREKLTAVQRLAAGIQFVQDEQFFIRPKSEIAEDSKAEAA